MKKLFFILVFFSSSVFANEKIYYCQFDGGVNILDLGFYLTDNEPEVEVYKMDDDFQFLIKINEDDKLLKFSKNASEFEFDVLRTPFKILDFLNVDLLKKYMPDDFNELNYDPEKEFGSFIYAQSLVAPSHSVFLNKETGQFFTTLIFTIGELRISYGKCDSFE